MLTVIIFYDNAGNTLLFKLGDLFESLGNEAINMAIDLQWNQNKARLRRRASTFHFVVISERERTKRT